VELSLLHFFLFHDIQACFSILSPDLSDLNSVEVVECDEVSGIPKFLNIYVFWLTFKAVMLL
jgi:hypothetical protein